MSTYTIKFNGTTHNVTAPVFFSVAFPFAVIVLSVFAWAFYIAYMGCSMLSYYSGFHPIVAGIIALIFLTSVTVTVNGVESEKAVLPKAARKVLQLTIAFFTFYFLYTVKEWNATQVLMLASPMILFRFTKFFKKFFKSQK
jgi:hypothetical protein